MVPLSLFAVEKYIPPLLSATSPIGNIEKSIQSNLDKLQLEYDTKRAAAIKSGVARLKMNLNEKNKEMVLYRVLILDKTDEQAIQYFLNKGNWFAVRASLEPLDLFNPADGMPKTAAEWDALPGNIIQTEGRVSTIETGTNHYLIPHPTDRIRGMETNRFASYKEFTIYYQVQGPDGPLNKESKLVEYLEQGQTINGTITLKPNGLGKYEACDGHIRFKLIPVGK